jgi:hypothetical protein
MRRKEKKIRKPLQRCFRRGGTQPHPGKETTMNNINTQALITACETISQRCTKIADTHHGSAWLFDKLMRYFSAEPSSVSVTVPVFINEPVMADGEATISRDGTFTMRTAEEA